MCANFYCRTALAKKMKLTQSKYMHSEYIRMNHTCHWKSNFNPLCTSLIKGRKKKVHSFPQNGLALRGIQGGTIFSLLLHLHKNIFHLFEKEKNIMTPLLGMQRRSCMLRIVQKINFLPSERNVNLHLGKASSDGIKPSKNYNNQIKSSPTRQSALWPLTLQTRALHRARKGSGV